MASSLVPTPPSALSDLPSWQLLIVALGAIGASMGLFRSPPFLWLWRRFVASAEQQNAHEAGIRAETKDVLDERRQDAQDLRAENAVLRADRDRERASGVRWYERASMFREMARDYRHEMKNMLSGRDMGEAEFNAKWPLLPPLDGEPKP